jgi:hypothetical protein
LDASAALLVAVMSNISVFTFELSIELVQDADVGAVTGVFPVAGVPEVGTLGLPGADGPVGVLVGVLGALGPVWPGEVGDVKVDLSLVSGVPGVEAPGATGVLVPGSKQATAYIWSISIGALREAGIRIISTTSASIGCMNSALTGVLVPGAANDLISDVTGTVPL